MGGRQQQQETHRHTQTIQFTFSTMQTNKTNTSNNLNQQQHQHTHTRLFAHTAKLNEHTDILFIPSHGKVAVYMFWWCCCVQIRSVGLQSNTINKKKLCALFDICVQSVLAYTKCTLDAGRGRGAGAFVTQRPCLYGARWLCAGLQHRGNWIVFGIILPTDPIITAEYTICEFVSRRSGIGFWISLNSLLCACRRRNVSSFFSRRRGMQFVGWQSGGRMEYPGEKACVRLRPPCRQLHCCCTGHGSTISPGNVNVMECEV